VHLLQTNSILRSCLQLLLQETDMHALPQQTMASDAAAAEAITEHNL
jgi:hypothetical protein